MQTYTNHQLKTRLENKGIKIKKNKEHLFNKYSYYQIINAYKNIFCEGIETIDDIENNIILNKNIDKYIKNYNIKKYENNEDLIRKILLSICKKYSITYKNEYDNDMLKKKIKNINYYNHLYSNKVIYSDFIRIYKFEHELRNILLRYTLIIEENLKNVLISYLNKIGAKDNFLSDINQYNTTQKNINNAIDSIKKILDKQTNKYSNPIKRKNSQEITIPYWIIINELTLGETIKIIINLNQINREQILIDCINYFTKDKLNKNNMCKDYYNKINVMREILYIIGLFRNSLAHNQPIYNFNVKEFYSTKNNEINYILPKANTKKDKYILTTKYMSYLAIFFGSDKYNSFSGNSNIDLSWIIYVLYKMIKCIDKNSNIYNELIYIYKKYNIILRPNNVSINNLDMYNELLIKLETISNIDFKINNIKEKYKNNKKITKDLITLNKDINNIKKEITHFIKENKKNNECNKYTHFLFDKKYTKYTGIDKKYFDKLKNN